MSALASLLVGTVLTITLVLLSVTYGIAGFAVGVFLFMVAAMGCKK